ncbi:MAG: hypothetical protein DRH79_01185, partial [Candidatus Cloacimonadota bacterium]
TLLLGTYGCSAYEMNLEDLNTGSAGNIASLKAELNQNYPNPFNPETTISFNLKNQIQKAAIEIFNVKGQKIKTLKITDPKIERENKVVWNGDDNNGNKAASGTYLYRLMLDGKPAAAKKMLLLK